jgi:hypothetical protein
MPDGNLKWIALAGLVYWLYVRNMRPKWVDDLLLRGYAADHLDSARGETHASMVAAHNGLPIGWALQLKKAGLSEGQLEKAANSVDKKMVQLGQPINANPETLAQYKGAVLNGIIGQAGRR